MGSSPWQVGRVPTTTKNRAKCSRYSAYQHEVLPFVVHVVGSGAVVRCGVHCG